MTTIVDIRRQKVKLTQFSDLVRKFRARSWKRQFPLGRLPCASQQCRRGFKLRAPWAPELPRAVTYISAATSPIIAILWGWCEDDRCEFNHCSQPGHLTQVQWGYGAMWAWSVPLAPSADVISQQISCKFWSLSLPSLCAMLEAICDPVYKQQFSVDSFRQNTISVAAIITWRSPWTCYLCVFFLRPGFTTRMTWPENTSSPLLSMSFLFNYL